MTTNNARWLRQRAARDLASQLGKTRAIDPVVDSAAPLIEDDRTRWRRRLQQRRCLACGARQIVRGGGYFCIRCRQHWRYCSTCETLRVASEHGKDSRCKGCASAKALSYYHARPDANLYRLRLKELARRKKTRADQIFDGIRRRIALADFVKRTPGMSWRKRAALVGVNPTQLESSYWRQCRDDLRDVDASDHARNQVLRPR